MAVKVCITRNFEENLDAIREHLLSVDPASAVEAVALLDEQILAACALLSAHPKLGRIFGERFVHISKSDPALRHLKARSKALGAGELREYVLGDYLLLYAAGSDSIHLLAVKHHRQLTYRV